MPAPTAGFAAQLDQIGKTLVEQSHRVAKLFEAACDAVFAMDVQAARAVVDADDEIDRVDIEIEARTVALLVEVASRAEPVPPAELRRMLVIVKVNNELERTADSATAIASLAPTFAGIGVALPDTLRVLTNSVAGILRDITRSIEKRDPKLAKLVLDAEDTVEAFKSQLLRDAERRIAAGEVSVDHAFAVHELTNQCERIADHATNIAEQVIYATTGAIVRHTEAGWVELPRSS
ncbi:MAG: PhoU domain-containing protein [Planctomycetota bacterium]|nr:PhoU domain-containing protein [Planctomycetota bacterium]